VSGTTVRNAKADQESGALAVVRSHWRELQAMMPTHVKPLGWYAGAQAALLKDKDLLAAANANPGSMMTALNEAAQLGLLPGTDQYYLTWRKLKTGPQVLGIVGYQGEIELIYRAGAVSSVVVEVVRKNDVFVWRRGSLDSEQPPRWQGAQQVPYHPADWFGDRGDVLGAYAYAVMKDGAISKVVVVDQERIRRALSASPTAKTDYSPWKTDFAAMVMKTAAHDLQKWVPTSAEYRREELRAAADVAAEHAAPQSVPPPALSNVVDAEVVNEPQSPPGQSDPITSAQLTKLHTLLGKCGVTEQDAKRDDVSTLVGRQLASTKDLTKAEGVTVIDVLERAAADGNPVEALGQIIAELAGGAQ
jgi:recombination protein RecT